MIGSWSRKPASKFALGLPQIASEGMNVIECPTIFIVVQHSRCWHSKMASNLQVNCIFLPHLHLSFNLLPLTSVGLCRVERTMHVR